MKSLHFSKFFTGFTTHVMTNAGKCFWVLGRHAFLVILIATVVNILLGGILFYYFVSLAKNQPLASVSVVSFQERAYESLLQQQQEKANAFAAQSQMQYTDPFHQL